VGFPDASAFSACSAVKLEDIVISSAVKLEDIVISLEKSTVPVIPKNWLGFFTAKIKRPKSRPILK
jgi:hypothetical protein